MTVSDVAENNFYVNVTGTIANVEKAFHVQIDSYTFDGTTYFSNTADPNVNDSSGAHVAAITGLDNFGAQPNVASAYEASAPRPVSTKPNGTFFASNCFTGVESHSFGAAHYSGNRYGSPITSNTLGNLPPCGYSPSEVQKAYNVNGLYASRLDGTGQTVVIVDAFGSPTIQQDANAFSQIYGLPPVDLTISRAPGVWQNSSPKLDAAGWAAETTLDVEWVHAMAPGAKIDLVVGPTDTGSLDEAINYAVVHHLGNVISNSWSDFEGLGNPAKFDRDNRILEQAAAEGIDVNFSSGDWGDNSPLFGFKAPSFPADSPFATGIGGTSLALNPDDSIKWQTTWGTDLTKIATASGTPLVPPAHNGFGFQYGSGGGFSLNYAKPTWQTGTPGTTRAFPDISMDADPYTGVEIIETVNGQLTVSVIGGTSVSCPLFSGLMAIATQEAGHGLGQVAPLLYGGASGAITDVTQVDGSPNNVSGTDGVNTYTADQLAQPPIYPLPPAYYSAFYNSPFSGSWYVLDFGVDTTLYATPGWDDATGLGAPDNGTAFVNAVAGA